MIQATIDQPLTVVHGRVRSVAAAQGWLTASGGSAHGPNHPMLFRRGLGSFKPAEGLAVELAVVDANRTEVSVTVWRGSVVADGYDADHFLRALTGVPQ